MEVCEREKAPYPDIDAGPGELKNLVNMDVCRVFYSFSSYFQKRNCF